MKTNSRSAVRMRTAVVGVGLAVIALAAVGSRSASAIPGSEASVLAGSETSAPQGSDSFATVAGHAETLIRDGRRTFRHDTFGDEAFWGGLLRLHEAIAGDRLGGVGPGVGPSTALAVGLKVDVEALPSSLVHALKKGKVDLQDPATTLALLKLDSVVGVRGFFDKSGRIASMGIQCALCHSTVDDSLAPGIGRRLDGWANRDLDVGAIVALAPDLSPFASLLGVDDATVRAVLRSWGPGKFDAALMLDGKAFRPDGTPAATLIPPAFGLAGVNLHTFTGWGSVTHWNGLVANLEMHGKGTFYDPRLEDAAKFPLAAANGFGDVRSDEDRITPKLAALHVYQLAIPAPKPRSRASIAGPPLAASGSSGAAPIAPAATSRRSSPSPAGTCTPPPRSASTTSRPSAPRTSATARLRSRVSGLTRRAASTTTGASPRCSTSSSTTIPSWGWASALPRRRTSSST